jgi:hypothetical protein
MVHKYPHLYDAKQEIINLAIAELETGNQAKSVPLVAAAERDRIVLYNWNEAEREDGAPIGPPHWKFNIRGHTALLRPP